MTPASPRPIYLDYHATTPVDPRVAAVVLNAMTRAFGNPNSEDHLYGEEAATLVADARCEVAALVGAEPEGIHFTSGSTEAIRIAIAHAIAVRWHRPVRVAVSTVEHRAVLDALRVHEQRGEAILQWLPVDSCARLDMGSLEAACQVGVDLVCVMAANNEVGTLYPIDEVVQIAHQAGAQTLVDATQAAGRIPLHATEWGVTYLAISGHKLYGPKGVGALIASPEMEVRRSRSATPGTGDGTPNVPAISGLGEACRLRQLEMDEDEQRAAAQRDHLEELLVSGIDGLVVNGHREHRLPNNLHVSVPGIPNDAVTARLRRHVAISTGAACSSGAQEPSHVLLAMGLPPALQDGALRISTGKFTSDEDIQRAAELIVEAVIDTRAAVTRSSAPGDKVGSSEIARRGRGEDPQ